MLLGVLESLAMVSGDSALYPQPEAQPGNNWRLVPHNHYRWVIARGIFCLPSGVNIIYFLCVFCTWDHKAYLQ